MNNHHNKHLEIQETVKIKQITIKNINNQKIFRIMKIPIPETCYKINKKCYQNIKFNQVIKFHSQIQIDQQKTKKSVQNLINQDQNQIKAFKNFLKYSNQSTLLKKTIISNFSHFTSVEINKLTENEPIKRKNSYLRSHEINSMQETKNNQVKLFNRMNKKSKESEQDNLQLYQSSSLSLNSSQNQQTQVLEQPSKLNFGSLKNDLLNDEAYINYDGNMVQQGNFQFNYIMRTKAGVSINKQTKINQDSSIVCSQLLLDHNLLFFAVADGHGTNGHHVSGYIQKNLTRNILKFIKPDEMNDSNITNGLIKGFQITHQEICSRDFDTNLSGSTLISITIHKGKIYCANVGDSRAIIGKQNKDQYINYPLSVDQKPSLESEKQRILNAGGRIGKLKDLNGNGVGPLRVWMQTLDLPGLAMTRSFGDKMGAKAGVIAEPEITEYNLQYEDKFIVIASDGVFEYLTDTEIVKIISPYYEKRDLSNAIEKLMQESTNAWKRESIVRDDITAIVIFIN